MAQKQNKETKQTIEYFKEKSEKQIERNSNKIETHINSLLEHSKKRWFTDILNYYRNLVEYTILYIYILSSKENKEKITETNIKQNSKHYLRQDSDYKFLLDFYSKLSDHIEHETPLDDNSERLFFYYWDNIYNIKKILEKNFKIQIIKNLDNLNSYIIANTSQYYLKIVEKINITSHTENKEAKIFIHNIEPFFWSEENEIYYEVSFLPLEDLESKVYNKKNLIIAYTKIKIKKGHTSKITYQKVKIDVNNKNVEIYLITQWKIQIQEKEINHFINSIQKTQVLLNKSEIEFINLFLTNKNLNLLELLNNSNFQILKKELETREVKTPFLDFLKNLNNNIQKNIPGTRVIKYLLCHFNTKNISEYMNNDFKNNEISIKHNEFNINYKTKPFDNFPLTLNLPNRFTINNNLEYLLDKDSDYTSDKLVAHIKRYCENTNNMFYDVKNSKYSFEKIIELVEQYNKKLKNNGHISYKLDEQIKIFDNKYLFINSYVNNYIQIKKILRGFLNLPPNRYYDTLAEKWLNENTEVKLNNNQQKILKNIFKKSSVGIIYGSPSTGKTSVLKYINEVLKSDKKLILTLTNNSVNNLEIKIGNNFGKNKFMTIKKFFQIKQNDYDILILDECSVISNRDFLEILNRAKFKKIILVGDEKQIDSIAFGNWFDLILREDLFKDSIWELTKIQRTDSDTLKKLWEITRQTYSPSTGSTYWNKIYEYLVKNEFFANLEDLFTETMKINEDYILLTLNYEGLFGINNLNNYFQEKNVNKLYEFGFKKFKIGDPVLFFDISNNPGIPKNTKGKILNISIKDNKIVIFDIELNLNIPLNISNDYENEMQILNNHKYNTPNIVIQIKKNINKSNEENYFNLPFELSYAISIHKAQGLEYNSVKIVLPDNLKNKVKFNVFYTAITRAKKELKIYCSADSDHKILSSLKLNYNSEDWNILNEYEKQLNKNSILKQQDRK
ncbi:AAA family ATPase [Mesomycoplasma hyorhinis]|uniref:AAA family ATPase n=1 Tax=Mesomycoplasma hyorhinis TaxID=2100 RepID=UPI003DA560C4